MLLLRIGEAMLKHLPGMQRKLCLQLTFASLGDHGERCQAVEGAAQGPGGVPIPGGVQETTGRGTQSSGPGAKVVFGQRLDSMVVVIIFHLDVPVTSTQ